MQDNFDVVFDQFIDNYKRESNESNRGLITQFDKDFISPCFKQDDVEDLTDGADIMWQPVRVEQSNRLDNIAQALDIEIHADVHSLFGRYYSFDLNAQTERGRLTILQAINEEDFQRLQKNLIAHVLMKKKLKQEITLFFALTDEEDFVISVLPQSGEVVLEYVGKPHQETLAANLVSFFAQIAPHPQEVEL